MVLHLKSYSNAPDLLIYTEYTFDVSHFTISLFLATKLGPTYIIHCILQMLIFQIHDFFCVFRLWHRNLRNL